MKQDYTMYIYKADRRTKTGERLFSTTVWTGRTEAACATSATDSTGCTLQPRAGALSTCLQ